MSIIQTYIALIKDVVTILATAIAGIVAIIGLQTWKRQLTANAEHDLARRVLAAVYKVRTAVINSRWDIAESGEPDKLKQWHEKHILELDTTNRELDVILFEAQAVWGEEKEYDTSTSNFSIFVYAMKIAFMQYYSLSRNPHDSWQHFFPYPNPYQTERDDAYSKLFVDIDHPDKDKFLNELQESVKQIEEFLRPKLTLKPSRKKKKP